MNSQGPNESQTDLNRILEIIGRIGNKSENGNYIYRGEPECYPKISSTLYRELEEIKIEHPERIVEKVQEAELEEAKKYTSEGDQFELLTQLQHFGGKTNLIDFTTDYCIALFFACDGYPSENGRIILQNKNGAIKDWIKEPQNSDIGSRPDVQKSAFVRPPEGFIEPHKDDIVKIPKDLKHPLLKFLEKEFCISAKKIYHDIHGFIRSQDLRWRANAEYNLGVIYQNRRDESDNPQEKTQYNQKAIEHFTNAIKLKSDFAETYKNRGVAYDFKGDYDRAIEDYSTMIKLTPNDAEVYNDRGNTYRNKSYYTCAIEDYTQAIQLNPRFAEAYNNRGSAYFQKGETDPAIKDFDKAIELKNDYANAYYNRGVVYDSQSDYDRVISDYTQAIELKPDFAEAYCDRGSAYAKKDMVGCAIDDFTKAIELKPDFAKAYCGRGIIYGSQGNDTCAIQDYDKAIALKNDYGVAYNSRGLAKHRLGHTGEAKRDLQTALELVELVGDEHLKTLIEATTQDLE